MRALTFYALTALPGDVVTALLFGLLPTRRAVLYEPLALAVRAAGYLAVAVTMRSADGFRGLHERVSGTRVVRPSRRVRRRAPPGRRLPSRPDYAREVTAPSAGVLKSVGAFRVRGAVRWESDRRVLLGEDSTLERPVWLVVRPRGSAPPPASRRDLARPSRPRWLAGGEQAEGRWDAYSAPTGCPLADLAGPTGLPWADARPILQDLADELTRARADGTLPPTLTVEQVWVQADGSVLLADPLGPPAAPGPPAPDRERALDLLRRAAAVALEGGRRRGGTGAAAAPPASIRAAVPVHAARALDRLLGRPRAGDAPYHDPAELAAALEADRDKPTEVDRVRRAVHLGPVAAALAGPLALALFLAWPGPPASAGLSAWLAEAAGLDGSPAQAATLAGLLAAAWVLWAALTRGGLLLGLAGVALVRADSRPAERWRCAWRALVAWAPPAALLAASCWARAHGLTPASWSCWVLALAAVLSYPVLALLQPARSPHDRLAGTALVPE